METKILYVIVTFYSDGSAKPETHFTTDPGEAIKMVGDNLHGFSKDADVWEVELSRPHSPVLIYSTHDRPEE